MRQAVRFSKRYVQPRAILAAVGFSVICWACPSRLEFTDNATFQEILWVFSSLRPAHRVVRILNLPPKARELPIN
jgi:hypothetical protein